MFPLEKGFGEPAFPIQRLRRLRRPLLKADRFELVARLRAQELPDKTAQFAGNGHQRFVALQFARGQAREAAVQAILRSPTDGAHLARLTFLAFAQLLGDLGRRNIMLRALD